LAFTFYDSPIFRDGDLELVTPDIQWIEAVLAACHHPTSLAISPSLQNTTRQQLIDFVNSCPDGHQLADPSMGLVPSYHFWMKSSANPQLPITGGVGLRISNTYDVVMYYGHFGYHVYPPSRGNHYAERACRLLLPLAARHGIHPAWITCNPDNYPSRRTCQRLGAVLVETVPVPRNNLLYLRGETEKCRYRLDTIVQ